MERWRAERGAGRRLSQAVGGRGRRALTQAAAPGGQAGASPSSGTWAPGEAPGLGECLGRERPALLKDVWGKPPTCSPGRCHPRGASGAERLPSPHHPAPTPPEPRGTCQSPHSRRPRLAVHHRPNDEDGEAGHGAEAGVGGAEAELPARRGHGRRAPGARASTACGESQVQGREPSRSRRPPRAPPRPAPSPLPAPPAAQRPPWPEAAGAADPQSLAPEVRRWLGFLVVRGLVTC